MCVRYVLNQTVRESFAKWRVLGLDGEVASGERFPGDEGAVIRPREDGRLALIEATWGLTPVWAKEGFGKKSAYNARAETLLEKPTFREPFRRRRCLVPASAFYERADGRWLRLAPEDEAGFAFAGLYEDPNEASEGRTTYTLVTTSPSETIAAFHDRMPVVLDPGDYAAWLDPEGRAEELRALLVPARPDAFRIEDAGPIGHKRQTEPTLFE